MPTCPHCLADLPPDAPAGLCAKCLLLQGLQSNTIATDPNYKTYLKVFGKTVEERKRFLYQGGLKIYTTYQPQLQREAEAAVRSNMPSEGNPYSGNPESALTSLVPQSGAIRAMVGGPDFLKRGTLKIV